MPRHGGGSVLLRMKVHGPQALQQVVQILGAQFAITIPDERRWRDRVRVLVHCSPAPSIQDDEPHKLRSMPAARCGGRLSEDPDGRSCLQQDGISCDIAVRHRLQPTVFSPPQDAAVAAVRLADAEKGRGCSAPASRRPGRPAAPASAVPGGGQGLQSCRCRRRARVAARLRGQGAQRLRRCICQVTSVPTGLQSRKGISSSAAAGDSGRTSSARAIPQPQPASPMAVPLASRRVRQISQV